jgi:subtilisin-like proprotein convertase family protein
VKYCKLVLLFICQLFFIDAFFMFLQEIQLAMNNNQFRALILVLGFVLLAACGGGGGGGIGSASVAVTPTNPTLPLNRSLQLVAILNGTSDFTTTAVWTSSDTNVITVDALGRATPAGGAIAGQSATITATYSSISASGTTVITLGSASSFTLGSLSDPLAGQQWHLNNIPQNAFADGTGVAGQDIAVSTAYSSYGFDGAGVTVAVVDSGMEILHEDLNANVVPNGSWNFQARTTDPTYSGTDGDHGTAVAGLIAAARNNVGGIGVASGAGLKGFNVLNPDLAYTYTNSDFAAALGGSTANPNSRDVYIFNQSYGYSDVEPVPPIGLIENTLAYGATNLRNRKGALYVKAAGNGFNDFGYINSLGNLAAAPCTAANALGISCEDVHVDPENSLPYNIVVSALGADGIRTSYSTTGSAVWVSAPGGEYGGNATAIGAGQPPVMYAPAMITTDQSGCAAGYARTVATTTSPLVRSAFNGHDGTGPDGTPYASNPSCNYTNGFNGTSSATPVTAGVIALVLEANPGLSWRDVKHILATTSTQVDGTRPAITVDLANTSVTTPTLGCDPLALATCYSVEPAWTTNAAGRHFHNWYGFGRVNAADAVTAAQNYVYGSLGTLQDTGWRSSGTVNQTIPDNNATGATSTITVSQSLTIEAVQIRVNVNHYYTGDIAIELTSPTNTRSVLKAFRDGMASDGFVNFRLASNAFYGETSTGTWTLKVVDGWVDTGIPSPPAGPGTLTNWSIRIYGH